MRHRIIQGILALVCVMLAAPLVALAALHGEDDRPANIKPTKAAVRIVTPTSVPTARVLTKPEPTATIFVPTTTPTPLPTETALPTTVPLSATESISDTTLTSAPPGTLTREGPGGLPYPLRLAQLNFGAVGHFYYTDRRRALQIAQDGGFQWVRQQIHWRDIEDRSGAFFWDELDNIVEDVHNQGMLLMISVVRSPEWYNADGSDGMPDDPETLARFLSALVQHYPGKVHAIQVWNEQNLAYENGGNVSLEDAGQYVELLAASYRSIKAVDPNVIVVSGAMAPTGINDPAVAVPDVAYLQAMYQYNGGMIRDYFDVQAVHPYGTANPPETLYPENPHNGVGWTDDPTFYFRHIENLRAVMEAEGLGHHQVWITEFGYATQNNTPGYEYGNQISYDLQRDYIVRALEYTVQNYPWVSNMFIWNLNFTILQADHGVDPLHEQGSFSILNADWTPRPAYFGIQEFVRDYNVTTAAVAP